MSTGRVSIRMGNPWLAGAYLTTVTAAAGWFTWISWLIVLSGKPDDVQLRFSVLLAAIPGAAFGPTYLAVLLFIGVRRPWLLLRRITVDDQQVVLPLARRSPVIPVADICGVGLVRQGGAGSGGRAWGLMIWTTGGQERWAKGVQLSRQLDTPAETTVGRAARRLYDEVLRIQGPSGPLAEQGRQRDATFSRFSYYERVWDPATGVEHPAHD